MIPADNSGPIFTFTGTSYPEHAEEVLKWVVDQARKQDIDSPDNVCVSRDGKTRTIRYEWEGNSGNSVSATEKKGIVKVVISADAEEIDGDLPDDSLFETGTYCDDCNESYAIIDGKQHSLDDLIKRVRKANAQKPRKTGGTKAP